jgi:hypothetical protein
MHLIKTPRDQIPMLHRNVRRQPCRDPPSLPPSQQQQKQGGKRFYFQREVQDEEAKDGGETSLEEGDVRWSSFFAEDGLGKGRKGLREEVVQALVRLGQGMQGGKEGF